MCTKLRNLNLLLYKNYIVRKRHWFGSIIEFFLPIIFIVCILVFRSTYDIEPIHVQHDTHFPIFTKSELINDHVPKSLLHLYYKPRNDFTKELMKNVTRCMELPHNQLFGFENEDDMLQSYEIQQGKDDLISVLAIDFDAMKFGRANMPKKLIYAIRSSQPIPDNLFDFEGSSLASDKLIAKIPIVALQMCLNDVFIDNAAPDGAIKPKIVIQKMPYPPYDEINSLEITIQSAICMLGGLIFLATIYLIPSYVSAEKTTGVNTLLKMNGVKSYENSLSWLVSGMLFSIIPIFTLTMFFNRNLFGQKPLYYHSNCNIIWLALFLNVTHIYAFCLHVASCFSKAWLAQMVATTVAVLLNILTTQLEHTEYFTYIPWLGIFCPTVSTSRIFDEFNKRENELTGVQWSNIFETVNPALTNLGSLGFILLFTILGIIVHFILAIYLEAVLPCKYGVQKSPLFFLEFLSHFWKGNRVCNDNKAAYLQSSDSQPKILEPVPDGALIPCIELKNLAKCFMCGLFCGRCGKTRKIDAIRGISMEFYKGAITALLGHNGAGKTTTFSILTGSTPPSAGTVSINGKDINENLDMIRNDLGVCPQENIVFSDLTVEEQLWLISLLKQKNKTRKQLIHEVDEMLEKLNISEKRDVMPDKLSGGQKRRLCLGMALIGDASTIFLDEPTSGMDPETRRGTWDLLLKYRNKKTIVITTHSMEEADVLGDRIAIMHSGQMKCYGTPMYLKKLYGHNYHEVTLSTTSWCDERKIREMVGVDAKMKVTHHGRIVMSIPFTSSLPEILDDMENRKTELGITGVSVSTITLEQVFLKAAEDEESNESVDYVDGTKEPNTSGYKHLTGSDLTRQKINALLRKKITYFKRDTSLFTAIIFGALLAVLLPVLFYSNGSNKMNSISLDLDSYQTPEALIYSKNQILGDTYKRIIESQGGTGTLTQAKVSLTHELLSRASIDLTYYKTRMIIAAEFNTSLSANGLYSGSATLSAPITVNAMSNLVLKTVAGDQYSIGANIGTLPRSLKQDAKKELMISIRIIRTTILSMTLFFHIIALFVKHPLLENSTKIKQLQKMAGASALLYWGTTFLIDYALYILITILTVTGIFLIDIFYESNTIYHTEIGILLLLFLLFGINALLLIYIHSFIKKQFHLVYSILSGVPLFLTFVVVTLSKVLLYVENAKSASIALRRIFSVEPHISFVFGYMKFAEIASDNARCRGLSDRLNEAACAIGDLCCDMKCSDGHCENPLPYFGNFSNEGGLEEFVLYLFLTPIIFVGILWLLEKQAFAKLLLKLPINKPKSIDRNNVVDSEVEKEKSIVRQAINQRVCDVDYDDENVFLVHELSKSYGKLDAVTEVNFRVKKNECFGLLGVNGAGKSTTFRMLTGEEVPTNGILCRGPYSIKTNRTEYLIGMGYCPQNDALIPFFNSVEHLSLFASLRGIPESEVASEVHSWIDRLRLSDHARNPCGNYSGGNKRRLNIAMALIASPELVLLDEPTTGVDPAARRLVWTILQNCQAAGQAILLTSHSMEECEVLCNRLVMMARGSLLCVGASQELKERFGAGFNITIKLNPARFEKDFIEIKKKMQTAFDCKLKDEHPGCLFYHVTDSSATWVKMFGTMNTLKSEYECIEDFTVSTSTLEQLFMQFARSSTDVTTESYASDHSPTCV